MVKNNKSALRRGGFYIDLGTENTLIYKRGQGWILNEPSFATFKECRGDRILSAFGKPAKNHLGRTPLNMTVARPLREGVIADYFATEAMLKGFFKSMSIEPNFFRPDMIISLPCRVTEYERRAVEEIGRAMGAKSVRLIDEPMAAAVGAGLAVTSPNGQVIVDIGGGTTEIAIISLGGVVYANAIRIGGHEMDQKIMQHLRNKFNILIGEATAEKLKINYADATLAESASAELIEFNGVDLSTGLPRRIKLPKYEINNAIRPIIDAIVIEIGVALSGVEPELAVDISNNGIWLAGGGALIKNLAQKIALATGLKVNVSREPLFSVAHGGAYLIEHPDLLEKLAV